MHKLLDRYRARGATEKNTHMADSPSNPDPGDELGVGPGRGSTAGTPRWVKVLGIVAVVLVLLIGGLMLFGGGGHGPGRHLGDNTPSGEGGGHTPPPGGGH